MQVHILERFPVIHVARGKDKVEYFSLVVDNQVQFETVEPAYGALSLFGDTLECPMLLLPFYVATAKGRGIDKGDPGSLAHAHHLDEDCQRHTNLAL